MRLPGVLSECFCHLVTGKTHCLSQGQRLRSKPSTGCHLRLNLSRQYPWKSSLLAGPPPSTPPPQSPFCSSAVVSDLPPGAFCWAPGCPHRVTGGPGMSSPWRNGTSSQLYQPTNKPTLPGSLKWGRQREGWEFDELGGRSEGGEEEQKG